MRCHVTVTTASCISSGRCVADAPDLFQFDDDRLAVVTRATADLTPEQADDLMDSCPGGAIDVVFDTEPA